MNPETVNPGDMLWHRAIPGGSIRSNEIHVWRVMLDVPEIQTKSLEKFLSNDELLRAGRFRFARDRKRFIVARGMLRQLLGRYLGKNPHEIRFEYNPYGKPLLASDPGYDTLSFNLSHSGEFSLYAVTPRRNIGIDIEHIQNDIAIDQMTRRFFSQREISLLEKIPKDKRAGVFFQYWTRKEAFIKALGAGVSFPIEQCDISLIGEKGFSPVIFPGEKTGNLLWHGRDLLPGSGYAAAIAVDADDCDISCRHYSA